MRMHAFLIAAAIAAALSPAAAQTEPYAGKTVTMIIGFGVGGGYDMWGRAVARHIGKHLPGKPNVVPQNMPGAGSFAAASHLYNVASRDGTVIGIIARDAALGPLSGAPGALFDPQKLSWLGTPAKETNICMAYNTAAVKTAKDLFEKQLIVGDTGAGTGTRVYPKALTELLGMKFRVVSGFRSSSDVFLAMERGEVEGFCESLDSLRNRKPDWIPSGKVKLLFQGGAAPHPDLKDVPSVLDFARSEEERQIIRYLYAGQGIGRPFVAPPNLPPERLKMLRDAFAATMKDPDFAAEVKKSGYDLDPEDGAYLAGLIDRIYATPKAIIARVGAMVK